MPGRHRSFETARGEEKATDRGCFWRRCTFCTRYKSHGLTYRLNGIPHVIEELEHHAATSITHFSLVDEMIPAKRFKQLAHAILKAGLDVHYSAMARPTADLDQECLALMYESGWNEARRSSTTRIASR